MKLSAEVLSDCDRIILEIDDAMPPSPRHNYQFSRPADTLSDERGSRTVDFVDSGERAKGGGAGSG